MTSVAGVRERGRDTGFVINRRSDLFRANTEPHLDALYRFAFRMAGNVEIARDLVQETCLKAYRFRESFQSGTNYRAWLFKIMMNTWIDEHRRRTEPIVLDIEAFLKAEDAGTARLDNPAPARDPESELMDKAFQRDASRAIKRLSPDIRAVVALAVFEERTYAEIAEILNCPLGTVRSRLSRGRQQLRADLRAYLDEDEDGGRDDAAMLRK
jgi:RNA polymerase sigma-70 factor (ECF subfamily)